MGKKRSEKEIDSDIENINKSIGRSMDVTACGKNLGEYADLAKLLLRTYKELRIKQSIEIQDSMTFGATPYNLQVQFGKKYGLAFLYIPSPVPVIEGDEEYLIRSKLDLMINGQIQDVVGDMALRLNYSSGNVLIYFRAHDLTPEIVTERAQEFFEKDLEVVVK